MESGRTWVNEFAALCAIPVALDRAERSSAGQPEPREPSPRNACRNSLAERSAHDTRASRGVVSLHLREVVTPCTSDGRAIPI